MHQNATTTPPQYIIHYTNITNVIKIHKKNFRLNKPRSATRMFCQWVPSRKVDPLDDCVYPYYPEEFNTICGICDISGDHVIIYKETKKNTVLLTGRKHRRTIK